MDGVFRRGGVWYARLVIPSHLRSVLGKTEFVASTGVREPALARVVATTLLAGWRRRLFDLSRIAAGFMDVEQISLGHPALSFGGYLSLSEAASVSGIDDQMLLRKAGEGKLRLFYRGSGLPGHLLPPTDLDTHTTTEGTEIIVPSPEQMSEWAIQRDYSGMLQLRCAADLAPRFEDDKPVGIILFDLPDDPDQFFAPLASPLAVWRADLHVSAQEVEAVREAWAATFTPEQIESARLSKAPARVTVNPKSVLPVSEAISAYMKVRSRNCSPDQARRVRAALQLIVELDADIRLCDMDSDRLEKFRDQLLGMVPANENKVRLKYGSTSIRESIDKVEGVDWPRISPSEQVNRLKWISSMFTWLREKNWIERNPSLGLVKESEASSTVKKSKRSKQESRDSFDRAALTKIFSFGQWFGTGRGTLTKNGTYREFCPFYYWLPLMGLTTGARINELAQLSLTDIRQSPGGCWFFDLAYIEDDPTKKKQKNPSSKRRVPVHSLLISLGLPQWHGRLTAAGYTRFFPELLYDKTKGYGKAATKWFSSYAFRLGWERNGKQCFHSFRSTLVNECTHELKLTEAEIAQISGHTRGKSALIQHYIKDQLPEHLVEQVELLNFNLPRIAPFDIDAGIKALKDALARKNLGRGAFVGS